MTIIFSSCFAFSTKYIFKYMYSPKHAILNVLFAFKGTLLAPQTLPLHAAPPQKKIGTLLHEKVPNGPSRCHTKRRMGARGCAHPSFGMTPTFQKKI